jgi:isopentenyl-diphosphate delta-isomerase
MSIMIPAWVDGVLVPVEKLEAHQKGLRHKAVSVFVLRGPEMLLQQRALGKYHTPGLWANTCCTHPDWDEDPLTCAVRRLDEELGIKGLAPDFRQNLEYRADVGDNLIEHEVVDVFVAHAGDNFTMTPNPDEVMAAEWVHHAEVRKRIAQTPDAFTPWMRIYMSEHADAIFGVELTG